MMADQQEQQPQEDEEEQQQGTTTESAIRFPAWVALTVFSVVAWVAMLGRRHEMNSSEKWGISVTTLSMVLGILSTLSYLYARHLFASQLPEIVMVRICVPLYYTVAVEKSSRERLRVDCSLVIAFLTVYPFFLLSHRPD
jgi:hypothetical protein